MNKKFLLILFIIVLVFVGYKYFSKKDDVDILIITSQTLNYTEFAGGQDLVSLLVDLRSLNIDDSIFEDPAYQSLQDFSFEIEPEPRGRSNPFSPLGSAVFSEVE